RSNGRESEQAPNGLSDLIPRPPVVGVEDVDELSRDQIRKDQVVVAREERRRPACLGGRLTGQMANEDIRIEQCPHRRAAARFCQVSARMRDHEAPRLPAGRGTLPANSRKSGTFANTARPFRTRNRTRSPALS